jgi:hypothetical protein
MELRQHPGNGQRCIDFQDLVSGERAALSCGIHRLLDLALSRNPEALQELPNLEVEDFLVHATSLAL